MMDVILIITAIATIAIATGYDLKWKYVPDYASYSFIVIALIERVLHTLETGASASILNALAAGALLYSMGYMLYKTGAWGGGDVKILTSTGILLAWFPGKTIPLFIDFLTNLMIIGALYTIAIIIKITISKKIKMTKKEKTLLIILTLAAIPVYIYTPKGLNTILTTTIIISSLLPYLSRIEKELFIKPANMKTLMDGDWLIQPVKIGKTIIKPKKEGLTKQEAETIKKAYKTGKLKKAPLIKEGIAYLPAFMITIIYTLISASMGIENIIILLMQP